MNAIPQTAGIIATTYQFVAATYFDGGHYTAAIHKPGLGWLSYDGLGTSITMFVFLGEATCVTHNTLNYVLFVRRKDLENTVFFADEFADEL